MRILLVEDETKMAQLVRRALKEDLHSVFVAHNGPDGLDLINTTLFDLIILDVMLPGFTGLRLRAESVSSKSKRRS